MRAHWLIPLALFSSAALADIPPPEAKAIFAGGCFWSMEKAFDHVAGVKNAVSGYSGGTVANPTYEQVSNGDTGHVEAVEVTYDPSVTSYEKLLQVFWHDVDPLDAGGQFCDKGPEYRSAIFYENDAQKQAAEASRTAVERQLKQKAVTELRQASAFYPAEDYHQHYAEKNPVRYGLYRSGCGRDQRVKQIWSGTPPS